MRAIQYTLFALILSSGLLAACSTMRSEQCTNPNWHGIGQKDGSLGQDVSHFQRRAQDCKELTGALPNADHAQQYRTGHTQGVIAYCQPANATQIGLAGLKPAPICPAQLEPEFQRWYQASMAVYVTKRQLRKLDEKIKDTKHALKELAQEEQQILNRARKDGSQDELKTLNRINHTREKWMKAQQYLEELTFTRITHDDAVNQAQQNLANMR